MEDTKITKRLSPLKAIRKFCLECTGTSKEVMLCTAQDTCPLYNFRLGHNIARRGVGGRPRKSNLEAKTLTHGTFGGQKIDLTA